MHDPNRNRLDARLDAAGKPIVRVVLAEPDARARAALYAFDTAGQVKPGWPVPLGVASWSGAALWDLDHDGHQEVVLGSNGSDVFLWGARR